ncbi:MAG TPA: ATP-binding protein [Bacteroidales bacterium]|nr:ATP-binding protein [Bacteroidales bacterium]
MKISFKRPVYEIISHRLEDEPRRFIQVIYGPRQVGKTTLINQFTDTTKLVCHYVSADAVPATQGIWIAQQWETARLMLNSDKTDEVILIIDEIQKIENWSELVKKEWDTDTRNKVNLKVVLLVSSRLLLQKGLSESLAGRFETIYLGHWSYTEMNQAFGITPEQFVWFGGYPGAISLIEDEKRWKSFITDSLIETSISKDILMLTRVDKPALLKRLFELGCNYSGQILSFTKIMGQLLDAGNTTTLANYLHLLDTAGLLSGIEKYSTTQIRQKSSSPKFQVHNTALISAQQFEAFRSIVMDTPKWGRWIESAIGAHLLNYSITEGFKLFYWRHRSYEVDFVLEHNGKLIGLEVKSGAIKQSSGMTAFKNQYTGARVFIVGNPGIPWQNFLAMNPVELFY